MRHSKIPLIPEHQFRAESAILSNFTGGYCEFINSTLFHCRMFFGYRPQFSRVITSPGRTYECNHGCICTWGMHTLAWVSTGGFEPDIMLRGVRRNMRSRALPKIFRRDGHLPGRTAAAAERN